MIIVFISKIKPVNGFAASFDSPFNIIVSHGIDTETDKVVILPQVHPSELGAKIDPDIGEWVIP